MGVDAEMMVRIRGKENWLTADRVHELAYELSSSIGPEAFMICWGGEFPWHLDGKHALEIMKPLDEKRAGEYERPDLVGKLVRFQDGDKIIADEDEQFIDVNLAGRYYGVDYERGNWPQIKAIAEWLNIRIPEGEVWYGGDSSGICMELFDENARERLTQYWATNGRRPYVHYSSGILDKAKLDCPFCKQPMANCGGGRDYSFLYCDGCGKKASKHMDGRTAWADRHMDYPIINAAGEFEQRKDPFR